MPGLMISISFTVLIMNNKILLVCVSATLILGGCDWVRSRLDLPTSKDIAAKKALIVKREMQQDSQKNAKLDSGAVQVSDTANVKVIAEGGTDDARLKGRPAATPQQPTATPQKQV